MGAVKAVGAVRLIGTIENMYVRRYSWHADDLVFTVAYSDDNFQKDVRQDPVPKASFRERTFPRAQYTYAGRLPEYVIPCNQKARYIRVGITARGDQIPLQKLIVEGQARDHRLLCDLKTADLDGDGVKELLVKTSNSEIVALSRDGSKRWSRTFPGEINAWNPTDLESDNRSEVLVYTTEDVCYALEGDGKQRWRADLYEFSKQGTPEEWERRFSPYCFNCVIAWRPDASGHREVIGWTHVPPMRIGQDLSITNAGNLGRAMFALTDRSVYGREVLVSVGSALLSDDTNGTRLVSRFLRGPLSGNGEFPVFVRAHAVADAKQKGFLALNPTSVEWVPAEPAGPGWGEFSEIPITASLVKDVDGDGNSELLIGYKDGFVRVYRLADGQIVGKICAGAPVTGLAALGPNIAVATRAGLRLFDPAFKELGASSTCATSLVSLDGQSPIVCAADETGVIQALGFP